MMIGCLSRKQDPLWNLCLRQFVSSRMRARKKCCWWMKLIAKSFLQKLFEAMYDELPSPKRKNNGIGGITDELYSDHKRKY